MTDTSINPREFHSVQIVGTGHSVPHNCVSSEELDAKLGVEQGYLAKTSGVVSRYVCDQEDQIDMAVDASLKAISNAALTPQDIDLVIGACAVPYQPLPATAPLVMGRLDIPDGSAAAFDVNASCLSFLSGFELAACKIVMGESKAALVFSSEVASRALPWKDQPDIAALFGDGAAAVVLIPSKTSGSSIKASLMKSYPSYYEACEIGAGGTRFDFHNALEDFAQNAVFRMDGKRLFRATYHNFHNFMHELLERAGWSVADVDLFVPHQASPLALEHMMIKTGLRPEQVINISANYGNQIAASIPTALDIAVRDGRISSGSRVVMLGTSAGVSLGGIALEF